LSGESFRLNGQVGERFGAPRSWQGSLTISPASTSDRCAVP